ncbi:MAG: menaquinone biosynthetic enzyme MqnA/MqnD family protein [Terriglobia bacterium]
MKPRVSVVQYLNTVPLVWGMMHGEQKGKFDLTPATPAGCADAIRSGQADVGIIPAIEYQRIPGLEVMDGLSISSKREVRSVLLLSTKPIEAIRTVAMDESSRTSVALVAILLRKFYGLSISTAPAQPNAPAMLARADAALMIGDPALAFHDPAVRVYDLAAEWRKFTGLPFVFAIWAGNAEARLGRWAADFQASLAFGLAHLDDIGREYAPRHHMTPEQVRFYLTRNINYNLDEENLEGLMLFYRLAHELALISEVQDVRFASQQSTAPVR